MVEHRTLLWTASSTIWAQSLPDLRSAAPSYNPRPYRAIANHSDTKHGVTRFYQRAAVI